MLFDKHLNLHHAVTHALKPFNAAIHRVKECGIEKRIYDRPHAMDVVAFQDICVVSWHVFFFWWGLLHGPQQGPDRMKEKKTIRLGKGKLLPKQKNPP